MYNMMTCQGWPGGMSLFGDCTMAWFGFVILVFLCLVLRRQCTDGVLAGTNFNQYAAFGGGLGGYILLTTLLGSARWSLLAGVLGIVVGGFVVGMFADTSGGGDSYNG